MGLDDPYETDGDEDPCHDEAVDNGNRSISQQRASDHRALLEAVQARVPFFFSELRRSARALAVKPAARGAFLRRFRLQTPWLDLFVKRQAVAFQHSYACWIPPAPEPDVTLLTDLSEILHRRRVQAEINAMPERAPAFYRVGESIKAAIERQRAFAEPIIQAGNRAISGFVVSPETQRDVAWFVRVQVFKETIGTIAASDGTTRKTVDEAIRRVARRLEIPLRHLPKTGRPPGVTETPGARRRQSSPLRQNKEARNKP